MTAKLTLQAKLSPLLSLAKCDLQRVIFTSKNFCSIPSFKAFSHIQTPKLPNNLTSLMLRSTVRYAHEPLYSYNTLAIVHWQLTHLIPVVEWFW